MGDGKEVLEWSGRECESRTEKSFPKSNGRMVGCKKRRFYREIMKIFVQAKIR